MSTPDIPLDAPDGAWVLYFDTETVYANALLDDVPPQTRGERVSYTFAFYTRHDADYPTEHVERARTILDRRDHAGSFVIHRTPRNRHRITEQLPAGAPSQLVGLAPAYDTAATRGVWGALDGYSAEAPLEEEVIFITLDVVTLAPFEQYDGFAAAQSDLTA